MFRIRTILRQSKLPVLLLLYPLLAWVCLASVVESEPPNVFIKSIAPPLEWAVYIVIALGLGFWVSVPVWASRYRKHPGNLRQAFSRGLFFAFILLAVVLIVQGLLFAVGLALFEPTELWIYSLPIAAGSIAAAVILLSSGLGEKPGVYVTLRAKRIQPEAHPRLAELISEICAYLRVPPPPHILVGLQPDNFAFPGTVFCPDGELEGGSLCFSLSLSSLLSIPELRALTAESILGLHNCVDEGRREFLSTTEGARDVVNDLRMTMDEWRWIPKHFIHPYWVVIRFVFIAFMRFPLYLGKEWIVFFVNQFWESRGYADLMQQVATLQASASSEGAACTVSAAIKEATLSLGTRFRLFDGGKPSHPLGEVGLRVLEEHPHLTIDARAPTAWRDCTSAWQYLQWRCQLSQVSLKWCQQLALCVTPVPSARSLFEDPDLLEAQVLDILESPFIMSRISSPTAS